MLINIDEATLETTLFPYIGYAAGRGNGFNLCHSDSAYCPDQKRNQPFQLYVYHVQSRFNLLVRIRRLY